MAEAPDVDPQSLFSYFKASKVLPNSTVTSWIRLMPTCAT